jgi:hypothetical protein
VDWGEVGLPLGVWGGLEERTVLWGRGYAIEIMNNVCVAYRDMRADELLGRGLSG